MRKIHLIIFGHAHGRQIRLLEKEYMVKAKGLPKYDGEIFEQKLVVNKLLSNTLLISRVWNPTEIVL